MFSPVVLFLYRYLSLRKQYVKYEGELTSEELLKSLLGSPREFFGLFNLPVLFFVLFIVIAFPYILARLSYHFYRYELRENSFRKEYGIIWKNM